MNRDLEQKLGQLTPRGAGPELRDQVLDAVGQALHAEPSSGWRFRSGLAVAASLVLAIVLNVWVNRWADRNLARLYGPPPVPKPIVEIAQTIASNTDTKTGRWFQTQFALAWQSRKVPAPDRGREYTRILNELRLVPRESQNEASQEDPEVDGDYRRRGDRDTSRDQRNPCLDYQLTA